MLFHGMYFALGKAIGKFGYSVAKKKNSLREEKRDSWKVLQNIIKIKSYLSLTAFCIIAAAVLLCLLRQICPRGK